MKKIKNILFFFILFLPILVSADTVDYDIKHYYINADILENGDMEITELLALKGSFNGYERDIVYKNSNLKENGFENNQIYNASDIEIIEIATKKEKEVTFTTMFDSDYTSLTPNQASNYGYIERLISDGKRVRMYSKAKNEIVLFKIKYKVKDVVVLHQDVAELYWTFIGEDYEDVIRDLQIKVNLPREDETDSFRIWAHGEMSGEIKKLNNQTLEATVNKLDANSSVDIRTTFSTKLVNPNLITKITNEEALNKIMEVETKRAEERNREREKIRAIYYILLGVSIFYSVLLIVVWIYVYFKYDKEYKSTFKNEYNRDFIDDYNVEVIDYLMHKNITSNALSASILNLIYKKIIKVEEIPTEKKKKEYKFTLEENDENSKKINDTENYLIRFLFTKVGKENTFTTTDLKNYAKGTKTCESFSNSYTAWKSKVIRDGKMENFYEKTGKAIGLGVLFLFIAIILNIMAAFLNAIVPTIYIAIVIAIIFFIYTLAFKKWTKKGRDHYARWNAFKKFLEDFGTFDTKELPEIVLWERYMVYATVFGLADKVAKVMNVKIKELETNGVSIHDYTPTFSDWYFFHSINTSVNNAITANTTAITQARANSISSSGSGFGGGFSSGGGFGGGGGGGRGF